MTNETLDARTEQEIVDLRPVKVHWLLMMREGNLVREAFLGEPDFVARRLLPALLEVYRMLWMAMPYILEEPQRSVVFKHVGDRAVEAKDLRHVVRLLLPEVDPRLKADEPG